MAKKTIIMVCETAWECEPRLVEGAKYEVLKSFFANGEGQYHVRDSNGQVFTVPEVFFELGAGR